MFLTNTACIFLNFFLACTSMTVTFQTEMSRCVRQLGRLESVPTHKTIPTQKLCKNIQENVLSSFLDFIFVISSPVTEPVPATLLHTHDNTTSLCFFWPVLACSAHTWHVMKTTETEPQFCSQPATPPHASFSIFLTYVLL